MTGKPKKENKPRMESDAKDSGNVRQQLQLFTDTIKLEMYEEDLVNIVSSRLSPSAVNIHDAESIETNHMESLAKGWLDSFHETFPKRLLQWLQQRSIAILVQ